MRNLPIDALRAFVVTAELGSVTAAAEQLGRSQPATSLQIKKLEDVLGTELFLRMKRSLRLSSDGRSAFDQAREILSLNDKLVADFSRAELAGQIRLGIPSEFATTLLPKIIGRFASAYPNVALEVVSDLCSKLLSPEHRSQYDLVLALHDEQSSKRRGLIRSDELVWVGSAEHELQKQTPLPLVLAQDGCLYRKRTLHGLNKIGRAWRIVHTNPDLSGIEAALQEGLGITVLARSTVPASLKILATGSSKDSLPALGAIDISLQYKKSGASQAAERLAEFIRASLV
ncbi:MAG: LysR family transcriptional regulator [Gammaproteobacteria bacterium]|nr:LysR family transcriptional regulator [Gammaproteobacteria bacterium]